MRVCYFRHNAKFHVVHLGHTLKGRRSLQQVLDTKLRWGGDDHLGALTKGSQAQLSYTQNCNLGLLGTTPTSHLSCTPTCKELKL